MRAEEFYNKWIVKHPDPYALLTGKPFADEFIKKSLIGFAEAYYKAKVEAINQAKIDEACDEQCPWENGQEGTYEEGKNVGFDFGANWVIEQLLKQ